MTIESKKREIDEANFQVEALNKKISGFSKN